MDFTPGLVERVLHKETEVLSLSCRALGCPALPAGARQTGGRSPRGFTVDGECSPVDLPCPALTCCLETVPESASAAPLDKQRGRERRRKREERS